MKSFRNFPKLGTQLPDGKYPYQVPSFMNENKLSHRIMKLQNIDLKSFGG